MKWSYLPAIIFIFTILALSINDKLQWRETITFTILWSAILVIIFFIAPQVLIPSIGWIALAYIFAYAFD